METARLARTKQRLWLTRSRLRDLREAESGRSRKRLTNDPLTGEREFQTALGKRVYQWRQASIRAATGLGKGLLEGSVPDLVASAYQNAVAAAKQRREIRKQFLKVTDGPKRGDVLAHFGRMVNGLRSLDDAAKARLLNRLGGMALMAEVMAPEEKLTVTSAVLRSPDGWDEDYQDAFEKRFTELVERGGAQARQTIGLTADWNLKDRAAIDWISGYSTQMSKLAAISLQGKLKETIVAGLDRGLSVDEMVADMRTYWTAAEDWQRERVARTETIRAHAQGHELAYREAGVERVEWITAQDERTCDECAPLDGQVYDLAVAQAMIPVHPNCRCTWTAAESDIEALRAAALGDVPDLGGPR